jgi:cytochrome c-L
MWGDCNEKGPMKKHTIKWVVAAAMAAGMGHAALATLDLTNTVTGAPLDLSEAMPEGRDTPAVKTFLQKGVNIYTENATCLSKAKDLYLSMCSGCHGHYAEGKIGPGLNDSYWTYPKNATDQGLFETIFGGAQGQMGPMYGALTLDDMLLVMSWVRHVYKGNPADATWLTEAQRKTFKPFDEHSDPTPEIEKAGACTATAG